LNDQIWRVADEQSDCKLLVCRYQALPNHVTKDYLDSIGAPYVYVCHKNDDVEICYINAGIIRPVQIFYKIEDGAVYVSDNIKYLFKNAELNASTLLEFLSFGFVLSDRTLIRNVHVLQAGEILEYKNRTLIIQDKYLYDTIPTREEDEEELMEKLWDVAKKIFKDVIKWTKGKTIVVPLSGGLDLSKSSLKIAKQKLKTNNIQFIRADVTAIPLRESSVDKVAVLEVLEHLPTES
jgi:asparagine synthetase B (glutamine-hydrolysing)